MHVYVGPAKLEGAEEGAWCLVTFRGCPVGRGAAGPVPPPTSRGSEGAAAASSHRAARRDWAARALVAVGRCGNMVSSEAGCLHGRSRKRFIYVPVLSQPPSRGGRCSPPRGGSSRPPPQHLRGGVAGCTAGSRAASSRLCIFQPGVMFGLFAGSRVPAVSVRCRISCSRVLWQLQTCAGHCSTWEMMFALPYSSLLHLVSPVLPLKFIFHTYLSLLQRTELREGPRQQRGEGGQPQAARSHSDAQAWLLQPGLEMELSIPIATRAALPEAVRAFPGMPCAVAEMVVGDDKAVHVVHVFFFPVTVAQGAVRRWQQSLLVHVSACPCC